MSLPISRKINGLLKSTICMLCFGVFVQQACAAKKYDPSALKIKASKVLAIVSQSIVKDYFYISKELNVLQAKAQIRKHKAMISNNIKYLEKNQPDPETRELLLFMKVTAEELNTLIEAEYSEDNAFLIMDMSEVLLEGAETITKKIDRYKRSTYAMLNTVEDQIFLLERMAKLYIANKAGFSDYNSKKQMAKSILEFDAGVSAISAHNYKSDNLAQVAKLKKHWNASQGFYKKSETGDVPRTVFLATELMSYPLRSLVKYHAAQ